MTNSALHFSIVPDRLYRRNTFSYSQWLVRNSRVVFFSLVVANVLVGIAMVALRGETAAPVQVETPALVQGDVPLALLSERSIAAVTKSELSVASHVGGIVDAPDATQGGNQPNSSEQETANRTTSGTHSQKECRLFGPVAQAADLDGIAAELEQEGGFPQVVETQVSSAPDYMVYVDALGSPQNAARVSQELAGQKIDSYLVNRDDGPILSVGVFSKKSFADRQLTRLANLGYLTQMQELPRSQKVFQLQGYVAPGSALYAQSPGPCLAIAQTQ